MRIALLYFSALGSHNHLGKELRRVVYLDFSYHPRAGGTLPALFRLNRPLIILSHLFWKGGAPIFLTRFLCNGVYLSFWLRYANFLKFGNDLRVVSEVMSLI